MSDELKPCPFCGGDAVLYEDRYQYQESAWIRCTRCGIHTQTLIGKNEVIQQWNTRIQEVCRWTQEPVDDYWTSACDYAFTLTDEGLPAENDFLYCPKCGGKIEIGEEQE